MDFDIVWELFEEAFSDEFRRSYADQKKLLNNKYYKIIPFKEHGQTLAFLAYWDFGKFVFIEHFATKSICRGKGIGKRMLNEFCANHRLVVLEVEEPNTETDKRRIKFYERCGFHLCQFNYYQPPFVETHKPIKLKIMSTKQINKSDFEVIKQTLFSEVYAMNEQEMKEFFEKHKM